MRPSILLRPAPPPFPSSPIPCHLPSPLPIHPFPSCQPPSSNNFPRYDFLPHWFTNFPTLPSSLNTIDSSLSDPQQTDFYLLSSILVYCIGLQFPLQSSCPSILILFIKYILRPLPIPSKAGSILSSRPHNYSCRSERPFRHRSTLVFCKKCSRWLLVMSHESSFNSNYKISSHF